MKKSIIVILMAVCSLKLNAQSLDGLVFSTGSDGPSPYIYFEENTVNLGFPKEITKDGNRHIDLEQIERAKYSYSIINGIYRITVSSDPKIELFLLFDNEFGYFSITAPYKYDSGILLKITDEIKPRLPRGGGESFLNAIWRDLSIK